MLDFVAIKKTVSFRLSQNVQVLLSQLSDELNKNKTELVEDAIKSYAQKKFGKSNGLMKYAGCIPAEDMDEILRIIMENRKRPFFTRKIDV